MKRSLIAVLFAMSAATVLAANGQYVNEAGEQDFHAPIAKNDVYRNDAGEQDLHAPIASSDQYRNEAGEQDVHTSIADAGDKGVQEQNYPQVG